jgi:hypothetical protein
MTMSLKLKMILTLRPFKRNRRQIDGWTKRRFLYRALLFKKCAIFVFLITCHIWYMRRGKYWFSVGKN